MNNIMLPHGAGSATPEMDDAHEPASNVGTKGQGNGYSSDCAHATEQCKRLATLTARAALRGVVLHSLVGDDGRSLYIATRWALTKSFSDLGEVEAWLVRVTGEAA